LFYSQGHVQYFQLRMGEARGLSLVGVLIYIDLQTHTKFACVRIERN
jgi:hypothetical protein